MRRGSGLGAVCTILILTILAAAPRLQAQSGGGQTQSPASSGQSQEIPDAPSTVQPPEPKTSLRAARQPPALLQPIPGESGAHPDQKQAPPPMPPVETVPAGSRPRNQINPKEDLYTITVAAHFVQVPVMVKDSDGRPVDGLLPKDFTVLENGKKQTLTYFTSDPFELSVAIVLDIGCRRRGSAESQSDLLRRWSAPSALTMRSRSTPTAARSARSRTSAAGPTKLTAALNELKLVRGRNNGPPVLGGPLGPQGPTVNGMPVGGPPVPPVTLRPGSRMFK